MSLGFKRASKLILVGLFSISAMAQGAEVIGNPQAPVGGTFYINFNAEPESLNPISSSDLYATMAEGYALEGLLTVNMETYAFEPRLAERWEVSKDGLTYTFYLRKGVKWQDGKPFTAEDVKFSFDAPKDPAFKAAHRIPYFENFESVEVIDPHTIRIKTKTKYFNNLMVMGSSYIAPKHVYGDPKKKNNKILVGTGPYKLETYNKGKNLIFVKNPNWWGAQDPRFAGYAKFERVNIRFVREENLQLEMAKKGQLDFVRLTPEAFVKKTEGAPWGKEVLKVKVENSDPTDGYGFVAWNLKNPLFKDKKVRQALQHLMNRQEMIEKFRFGMSEPATGPIQSIIPFYPKDVKPRLFDLTKAKQLLREAGWVDSDKNGVLDRVIDGKKMEFKFTLLFSNRDTEKYHTLYKEDLKKAGITMDLKLVEWNSFVKSLDEQNFEAITLGWGGGSIESDLKQIWHSESARPGGSNFISYSNKEVDKLIDEARQELDQPKRWALWQKIHRLIAEDAPYVFMFNSKYKMYGVNQRIGRAKDTLKFDLGDGYWWVKAK